MWPHLSAIADFGKPTCRQSPLSSLSPHRKVEDLQFRVEEESITKGDLEVTDSQRHHPGLLGTPGPALVGANGHEVQAAISGPLRGARGF